MSASSSKANTADISSRASGSAPAYQVGGRPEPLPRYARGHELWKPRDGKA